MELPIIKTAEDARHIMKLAILDLFRKEISKAASECKGFTDIQFPSSCSQTMAEEITAILSDDGFIVHILSGFSQIRILWNRAK